VEGAFAAAGSCEERWTVLDGCRLRYLQAGSGPALLLLHGLLGYSFSWRHALPVLAQRSTVYAVDMPGSGFSDRPATLDCTLRGCAQRLLGFLDSVGVPSCDLLGTSHGGAVAMMAASLAPERVRRLILVAPVNSWSRHGTWLAPLLCRRPISGLILRLVPSVEVIRKLLLRRLYGDRSRIRPGTLEGYTAPYTIPGGIEHALSVLQTWNRDLADLQSVLPCIAHIPALLLCGSEDRAVNPASAQPLSRQFTECKVEVLDGVGHLPYEEVPERFNELVTEFLCRSGESRQR
jgi:pimeloyl-ACP methyl ester carboxylesterase